MLLTVQLTGQETAQERAQLEAVLAALYGAAALLAALPPAVAVFVAPTSGAAESGAPLEEPSPAALFTAGAQTSTTAPAAPAGTSMPSTEPPAPAPSAATLAPPAPSAPVPPAPPAVGVELDAEGLPWDGRIHASTKTKTAKGVWKGLRGLNDEGKVNRIKAELRAALGASPAVAAVPAPPVPQPPAATGAGTVPPAPGAVAAVPGLPVVAAPPVVGGEAEAVTTFPQVMKKISSLRVGQFPRMTQDELTEILAAAGLPSLPTLATRADLIPDVNARIDALMLTKLN